jgi:hypothetical protein
MQANPSPWLRRLSGLAVCLLLCLPMNSCSAVTGLITGGFTGFVDLPSTLVQADEDQADDPDFYAAAVFLSPAGLVLGPFMGFFKGLALDYTWLTGRVDYADVYGGYGRASVWRPFHWEWIEPK